MKLVRNLIIAGWAGFAVAILLLIARPDAVGRFLPPLVVIFLAFSLVKATLIYVFIRAYRKRIMNRNENAAD